MGDGFGYPPFVVSEGIHEAAFGQKCCYSRGLGVWRASRLSAANRSRSGSVKIRSRSTIVKSWRSSASSIVRVPRVHRHFRPPECSWTDLRVHSEEDHWQKATAASSRDHGVLACSVRSLPQVGAKVAWSDHSKPKHRPAALGQFVTTHVAPSRNAFATVSGTNSGGAAPPIFLSEMCPSISKKSSANPLSWRANFGSGT